MKIAYIYGLSGNDGIIRYVGKTNRISKRFHEHRRGAGKKSHKTNWIASLLASGDTLAIHVLEEVDHSDTQGWQDAEEFWIKYLKFLGCPLTNTYEKSLAGWDRSPEAKKRMSEANLRRPEEVAQKISKTLTGRKMPEEVKQKLVAYRNTPEWKARLSEIHKGKKVSEKEMEGLRKGWIACRTPEVFAKISEANRGKPKPPHVAEQNRQRALAMKGKPFPPEMLAKRRDSAMRNEAAKILKILEARNLI